MNEPTSISYDTFASLTLQVGTITAIEPVPETDKLLKLTVDCGESTPRQIISGIRQYFDDFATLVGRQAIFLTNLEPRTIKGLESQGMLLAADHEATFALLTPSEPLPPGTRVR